jgi:hypothetical protein
MRSKNKRTNSSQRKFRYERCQWCGNFVCCSIAPFIIFGTKEFSCISCYESDETSLPSTYDQESKIKEL